ncbi:uncharacterized protein LOC124594124 [Schistocerca americana]|uniref:uncharacterized protein LOC124594124 n=1 Tax=Schistocerca americana TaxID=7009 RepID=UPI001F4FE242|nr:uncharacterized protein LOC124594124 [Schistocerca americana]
MTKAAIEICLQRKLLSVSCALKNGHLWFAVTEAEPPAQVFLLPCAVCGRTFRPESLQKHSKVCERNATKKRKIFDSSKQRIQGTELAEFLPALHMQQAKKIEKCRTAARQKSQWKEKHLEFMRAIRAARQVEKPLSPRASAVLTRPPESERCPHCDRQFGPKAFDRHIEWCREQKARVPKSPASIKAKERLEARLKYRAPVIRRISIREKYSPQAQRKVSDTSVHNSTDVIQSKSQAPSTMPSNSGQQDTLVPRQKSPSNNTQCNRSNITSTRSKSSAKKISQRSEPDVKKSPNTGVKSAISERKQISSQTNRTKAKKEEKTIINNQHGISRGKRPATLDNKPAENSKSAPQPNKTENDNAHSHSTEEVYNPFVSAERQMMELLADDGPVTPKVTSRVEVHSAPPYPKQNPTSLPTNNARAGLHSAPVAHKTVESNNFTPTSSSGPSESSLLNSSTENVNSSLTPPMGTDCTYDTLQSPPVWSGSLQELDDMLNHGIIPYDIAESLYAGSDERGSSLSLCSLQFLDHMSSQESSSTRKISKIRAKMEEASLQLQKSVALHDSSTELTEEPNDRFKGFSDNDNLPCSFPQTSFFLSRPDPNISTDTVSLSGSDGLVSRKLYGDLDCESESGEKEKADEVIHHNSQLMKMNLEDDIYCKENVTSKQYSATGKHSVDSAYSSLNRQSPKQYAQEQEHCNAISSSGSESSLPTLCKEEVPRPGTGDTVILSHNHDHKKEHQQGAVISHLPKFCHECGAQYPVSVAKFCCECGVRRLLI